MKVAIYDPYLDSVSGGEKYMLKAALCLSSNHAVSIFWDPSEENAIKSKALERFGYDLTEVHFVPNIFSSSASFFQKYSASKKYDKIFYLSDGSIPIVGTELYIHFQFPVEWVQGGTIKNRIKMHRVSKILCNSFFTKKYIDKKFSVDSMVLYPPAQTQVANGFEKENVILTVGRFGQDREGVNYKKQDIMIDVFKKMVDSGLKLWRFVLVIGFKEEDKEKIENLKKLIGEYPIEVVENPNTTQLNKWYGKAKIYWHAAGFGENLDEHPEKAEHFGISTVEAMAHKAVPVVINAGGQKEIVEEGKNGFLWNATTELIQKTNDLIQNVDLLARLSQDAAVSVARFDEKRFCEELEKALDFS